MCLSGDGHRFFERAKFVREKGRCSEKKAMDERNEGNEKNYRFLKTNDFLEQNF